MSLLTVDDVAIALQDCTRTRSLKTKQGIIRELFKKCNEDPNLIEMLLRVLLPGEVSYIVCCNYYFGCIYNHAMIY